MQNGDRANPGMVTVLAPDLRCILAPNPSPMTLHGTNTYVLGRRDLAVIDPGPDSAAHLAAILGAVRAGQHIRYILVTHSHLDHSPLAARLSDITGAPVLAFGGATAGRSAVMQQIAAEGLVAGGEGVDHGFTPDETLSDGDVIGGDGWRLRALWTPGHFGNHLCFEWDDRVFSGDLVMGWASSLVSPPDGDLSDFMASCDRLRARAPAQLFPGHGAPVQDAVSRISWLLQHRAARGAQILAALARNQPPAPASAAVIARQIYTATPAALLPAATRNVLAHLIDFLGKNVVTHAGQLCADTEFRVSDG